MVMDEEERAANDLKKMRQVKYGAFFFFSPAINPYIQTSDKMGAFGPDELFYTSNNCWTNYFLFMASSLQAKPNPYIL